MADVETKRRIWTLDELKQAHRGDIALAEQGGTAFSGVPKDLKFSGRLDVHMGTTQPKKVDEFAAPLAAQKKDIVLSSAVGSYGFWLRDPEVSGTYVGNAGGKILSLIDRVYHHHKFGYDKFIANLQDRGIDQRNFLSVVNDTGYSFIKSYSHEEEFAKSARKVGPVDWPGPELGPIIDAHTGVAGFYMDLKRMAQRKELLGEKADLNGFDEVTYMFFRPVPHIDDLKIYSFSARVPVTFELDPPNDYNGEVLNGYHFMRLRGESVPAELREKRISEIKDEYLRNHSPMAHALRDFFDSVDVPVSYRPKFQAAASSKGRTYKVSTQNNLMDASVVHDTDVSLALPRSLSASNLRYDHGAANSLHFMTAAADAVVLQPHRPEVIANWPKYALPMLDLYSSLVVKNQVCVETMYGKPLVVLQGKDSKFYHDGFTNGDLNWDNPKTERAFLKYLDGIDPAKDPWLVPIMLTRYLHEKNAVKQEEHHLFTQIDPSNRDFAKILEKAVIKGLEDRIEVPNYNRETYGMDKRGMFEVFIGGSAGTFAEDYVQAAEKLGYWCASRGYHVRTGGGDDGVMGAVARGVFRFMEEHPERAHTTHLSLIQTFRTIQFEGAAIDPRNIEKYPNVYLAIEETFDDRMESLFRVKGKDARDPSIGKANVIMFGGIGTFQEATRLMRYKDAGVPHLKDDRVIFFNQRQAGDTAGRQIRALDAYIHAYPQEVRRKHIEALPDLDDVKLAIMKRELVWARKYGPAIGSCPNGPEPSLQL